MPSTPQGITVGEDRVARCSWCAGSEDYRRYHDEEWGRPVADDVRLFEKLCLEGFQSGLSWLTILRKREAFRAAFAGFDFERLARRPPKVDKLLGDAGIVRHRGKIESVLHNAKRACELADEHGSLASYVWRHEPPPASRPKKITRAVLCAMTKTAGSIALSKDLRKRGWSFVGPTTVYAFMQAMGLVDDHLEGCAARATVEKARARFARPGSPR